MKKTTLLTALFLVLCGSTILSQTELTSTIYFSHDDYELTREGIATLEDLLHTLSAYTEYTVTITGHTDQDGDDDYNLALSKKRAETAREYLLQRGIHEAATQVHYLGESAPAGEGSKSKNRRVSVQATAYQYTTVGELVTQLQVDNLQEHTIHKGEATTIVLDGGTEVVVPANAFCHLDGSPLASGPVVVKCKEALEYVDMVDQQLFTQTADAILETGGMIYVEASQDGMPLRLQDGQSIELRLPEQKLVDGMEVFYGVEHEGATLWEAAGTKVTAKKEELFVKVDLSPLLEYAFEDTTNVDLRIGDMAPYPRPLRVAYPPNKASYSEEKYKEVYQKYVDVMEAHEKDKLDLPQRQKAWHEEAYRRTELLYKHKTQYMRSSFTKRLHYAMQIIKERQHTVSHHKLVGLLSSILDDKVDRIAYNERESRNEIFRGAVADIIEHRSIHFPRFEHINGRFLFKDLSGILSEIEKELRSKKFEMGYVESGEMGQYIMQTSNLGWINCDRFRDWPEEERMDFALGRRQADQQYFLVFKDMKSLIRPARLRDQVLFQNMPKGEAVRLVTLYVEAENVQAAYHDFVIGEASPITLDFRETDAATVRKLFTDI